MKTYRGIRNPDRKGGNVMREPQGKEKVLVEFLAALYGEPVEIDDDGRVTAAGMLVGRFDPDGSYHIEIEEEDA